MLESTLFAGEGRGVFCGYANKPQETAAVACSEGGAELKAAPWKEIDERGFIQLAAWARYGVAESFAEQTELALRYELLTDRTDMLLVKEMADTGDSSDGPVLQKIPQMSMASHDPRYEAQYDNALEFDPERGMEDLQLEFCRPSPSRARPFRLARNVVEDRLEQPRGPRSRRREVDQQGAESAGSINAAMAAFLLRPDEPLHIDARKVFEALQQAGAATLDDAVGVLEKRDVLGKAGVERLCLRWCFLGSDKKRIVAALVVLWGSGRWWFFGAVNEATLSARHWRRSLGICSGRGA